MAASVVLASLVGCTPREAGNSVTDSVSVLPGRSSADALLWKRELPSRPGGWLLPTPVLAGSGALVVLNGDTLLRIDGVSGTVLQSSTLLARAPTRLPGVAASTPAVAHDGSVWVGTAGGFVEHYDADGKLVAAERVFDASAIAPAVSVAEDGAVWAEGPQLAVLAPHALRWTAVAVGEGSLQAIGAHGDAYFAPSVPIGASPSLVAYGEDGSIRWTAGMGALPSGAGIPILANAVAAPNGMVLLAYGSMLGRWFVVGITGGEENWVVPIQDEGFDGGWARIEGVTDAGAVIVSFSSLVGAHGGIQSYSSGGRLQWTVRLDAPHQVLAVSRDGQIVAGLPGGGLVAINSKGERLWARPSPAPRARNAWGAALANDGRVFVSYGKTLYALAP